MSGLTATPIRRRLSRWQLALDFVVLPASISWAIQATAEQRYGLSLIWAIAAVMAAYDLIEWVERLVRESRRS